MNIGIITGSTRTNSTGQYVGDWVNQVAGERGNVEFTDIRLADQDLNFLTEATLPGAANGVYEDPKTTEWAKIIAPLDAFIFVTPEYNAAPPAFFKNAVDLLFVEWHDKPVGFVGYGFGGATRAINHWRDITANVKMKPVSHQVSIFLGEELGQDGSLNLKQNRAGELNQLIDEIVALNP